MDLRFRALTALQLTEPDEKVVAAQALYAAAQAGHALNPALHLDEPPHLPGRPARPALMPALQVPARSPFTVEGRAALLHAIAHIEFNAINLALDAVWRFADMPHAFYLDWLQVASEEADHFELLHTHLQSLGYRYGDFDAHDGLWAMTDRTKADIVARMALVPRTLEARGLDATPPLQAKFARAGDTRTVEILDVILREEIGHVAIGNRWYLWLCEREGLDALAIYPELTVRYNAPRPRPPFNLGARREAGFTEAELAWLSQDLGLNTLKAHAPKP